MGRPDWRSRGVRTHGPPLTRRLFTYTPTWLDREYKKSLKALSEQEQADHEADLSGLLRALQACRHPATDLALQRYRPTAYAGLGVPGLYEYRLAGLGRVIARCLDAAPGGDMLLVAITVIHDHERIKRLIDKNKKPLSRT